MEQDIEKLPLNERILVTASSKLTKHFRGLEMAGVINKDVAANMIGCVRKIVSIAKGDKVEEAKA